MIICTRDEYGKLENQKLFINDIGDLLTYDEAVKYAVKSAKQWGNDASKKFADNINKHSKKEIIDWMANNGDAYTLDQWLNDNDYETFEEPYTTPNGEEIVAFGYYGNDY